MFKSKSKSGTKSATTNIDTMIGESTEVTGNLVFSGGLLIEGKVLGNISSVKDDASAVLILNIDGFIEGDISVPNVVINGSVNGDIHVTGRAELAEGARIHGNVYYSVIEIASGAKINGSLVNEDVKKELEVKNTPEVLPKGAKASST